MFSNQAAGTNLFTKGFNYAKSVNWSSLLDGTQKTLGIINQAIPIFYQVKPIISNAKTMFKIADVMHNSPDKLDDNTAKDNTIVNTNKPIFYI